MTDILDLLWIYISEHAKFPLMGSYQSNVSGIVYDESIVVFKDDIDFVDAITIYRSGEFEVRYRNKYGQEEWAKGRFEERD